jgi:thiamine biosynthesis lipoprotein
MDRNPQNATSGELPKNTRRFSHHAMATLFEIFIIHDDPVYAEQAAFEAFLKLNRLEQEMSRFIENSDISRINTAPVNKPVQVGLDVFACLKQSLLLSERTNHAFDSTARSGNRVVRSSFGLDESNFEVTRLSDSVQIDLGGIGKGFAIDKMADCLDEWGIKPSLIHGGTSSALACDAPPGEKGWKVTVSRPDRIFTSGDSELPEGSPILATIHLEQQALSGSGIQKGLHILNPRTGRPAGQARAAWALAPDGTTSDALSTAFMVMDTLEIENFCSGNPDIGAMVLYNDDLGKDRILKYGDWEG